MEELYQVTRKIDAEQVKEVLGEIIAEYQPSSSPISTTSKDTFRNIL